MKNEKIYFQHIFKSIESILTYTQGITKEGFLVNHLIRDASLRNFEIIGEASKRVSKETQLQFQQIPWDQMADIGDKVIDRYYDVDLVKIWEFISEILPAQKKEINSIIAILL